MAASIILADRRALRLRCDDRTLFADLLYGAGRKRQGDEHYTGHIAIAQPVVFHPRRRQEARTALEMRACPAHICKSRFAHAFLARKTFRPNRCTSPA